MFKKFTMMFALVALMAAPAFASVQNVKISGSLATTSVIRKSFDLGAVTTPASQTEQNIVATTTSVGVAADLTDNVSTKIKLTNEGAWGLQNAAGNSDNNSFYLDEAYVTMKELLYTPLTVTVGRQTLAYGNQFLIGYNGGNKNYYSGVATDLAGNGNFDAVKAVLSYEALTVDVFASKINENTNLGNNDSDDTDLYGINANYKLGDKMSTVVEAYTFAKNDKNSIAYPATKAANLYVPGLRVSTNPIEGLNVQMEGAYELGSGYSTSGLTDTLSAYGLQGKVNYALPVLKDVKPVLSAGYTYLTGEKDPASIGVTANKSTAFQPLYENQNVGRIFDSLFTASNLSLVEASAEVTPIQDLTAKLSWYNVAKAQKAAITSINQPTSAAGQAVGGSTSKALGNEVDLDLSYAYTEDVKFGVSAGYFAPNKAFNSLNKDSASQLLSSVSVAF
ncbi:MAG: alginate export family protein [Candidatus Omnitrophota bacterium]